MREIEELKLERKQFAISNLISKDAIFDDVYLDFLLTEMMMQLTIVHKPFVQVLQEEKEIISVPSNNWNWFKSLFKLKHQRKVFYLNEFITFPNYSFPKNLGETRVYFDVGFYKENRINETSDNSISK